VGDRGLFSKQNLKELRGENKAGEFIVGMKLAVFKKRHDEFYDIGRYQWLNADLAVYETKHEEDRCIITWSRVLGQSGIASHGKMFWIRFAKSYQRRRSRQKSLFPIQPINVTLSG